MEDRELYRRILGIESPWSVASVDLQLTPKEVHIYLSHEDLPSWPCAECGAPSKLYDHQPERRWRHLDTCQYRTILHANPPRSQCPTHGVRTEGVLFTRSGSRFTRDFADLVGWLATTMNKTALRRLAGLQRVVRERPGSAGAIEICFPHTVRVCPAQEILARLHALASMRKASRI
jgi:transposase